jgi:hypothetical protein
MPVILPPKATSPAKPPLYPAGTYRLVLQDLELPVRVNGETAKTCPKPEAVHLAAY